jgi:hypothetical protein
MTRKERRMITTKYGYRVGDIVVLKTTVYDRANHKYTAGDRLRIVAITPKVSYNTVWAEADPEHFDSKEFFFNAVPAGSKDFWDDGRKKNEPYAERIRANFCTIRKLKKGEV